MFGVSSDHPGGVYSREFETSGLTRMPLYEYQCQECAEKTEVVQRFDAEPLTICESCGGALKKLISAPAIQFKGSGFYLTDYGKSGSTGTETKSSDSSETSKSSSSGTSDSTTSSSTPGSSSDSGSSSSSD